MHYYKRDIGQYYKKAGRLTMLQHGAYTMLMDSCYDREVFPTLEQAIDWCWASTNEEVEAVKFVLSKFFHEYDGVFKQAHITEVLDKYHETAAINKAIAIEREANKRAKRTKRKPTVNEPSPNKELRTINNELTTKDQVTFLPDELNITAWNSYLGHRRSVKAVKLKPKSEEKLIKWLIEQGTHETQFKIIEQSERNGWKGLFELKGNSNGSHQQPHKPSLGERATQARIDYEREHPD